MIVADTSAIIAIVFAEPEREAFIDVIRRAPRVLVSTVSVVEARMVVHGRRGERAVVLVDDLLRLPMFELIPLPLALLQSSLEPTAQLLARGRARCRAQDICYAAGRRAAVHVPGLLPPAPVRHVRHHQRARAGRQSVV